MSTLMKQPVGRSVLVLNDLASGRLHDLNRAARLVPYYVKAMAMSLRPDSNSESAGYAIDYLMRLADEAERTENINLVKYKQPTVL